VSRLNRVKLIALFATATLTFGVVLPLVSGETISGALGAHASAGSCTTVGSLSYCGVNPDYITFPDPNQGIGVIGTSATLAPMSTLSPTGLLVTLTLDSSTSSHVCSLIGDVVTYLHQGTCTIDANEVASPNFTAADQAQVAIDVVPLLVSGTVTNSAGAPLAGICVAAVSASGSNWAGYISATGSDGTYQIGNTGSPPADVYIEFSHSCNDVTYVAGNYAPQFYNGTTSGASSIVGAAPIAFSNNAPATNINAVLAAGSTISGTVTDASGTVDNIEVLVYPAGSNPNAQNNLSDANYAVPSSSGTYAISNLAAGKYNVLFDSLGSDAGVGQWYNGTTQGASTQSGATAVTVTAGTKTTAINAVLAAGGTISGVVTDQSSGDFLYQLCITAVPLGAGLPETVNNNTTYSIEGLAPGSYDVEFSDPGCSSASNTYAPSWYNGTPQGASKQSGATPVKVVAGSTVANINAALSASSAPSQGVQSVSFTSLAPTSALAGGPTYVPTATASSALPVSLSIDQTSTGCVMDAEGTVHFTDAGTCVIDADQYGDPSFSAATTVQQSIEVTGQSPSTPTISNLPASGSVGGSFTATISTSSGGTTSLASTTPSVCTVGSNGLTVTYVGAGTCSLTASVAAAGGFFSATNPTPSTIAITASSQVALSVTTLSGTVGTTLTLATSGGSGTGALTYSVTSGTATGCSLTGSSLSATTAGTCLVTATKAADATYLAVSSSPTVVTFATAATTTTEAPTTTTTATATTTTTTRPTTTTTKAPTKHPVPAPVTVSFTAKSSSLSSSDKSAIKALAKKLSRGASVTVTGYAKSNAALAKKRAQAVAAFLKGAASVTVSIKTVTNVAKNAAVVTTTKQ